MLPVGLFCIGLALVLGLRWSRNLERRESAQQHLERQALMIEQALHERVALLESLLRAGRTLALTDPGLDRTEWRRFVAAMEWGTLYPDIQGVALAAYVMGEDKERFEAFCRAADKQFTGFFPEGERPDYFVVEFTEPVETAPFLRGFDFGSDPRRREAAERARDTGRAAISAPLVGTGDGDERSVQFLHLLPIYLCGSVPAKEARRRAAIRGWVMASYAGEDFVRTAVGGLADDITYEIYDGMAFSQERSIARGGGSGSGAGSLEAVHPLKIGGRVWTMALRSTTAFDNVYLADRDRAFLVAGILLSIALAGGVRLLIAGRSRAVILARRMTSALRRSQDQLRILATTDDLTGVCNRRHFLERAERELARTQRFHRPMSLLMIDLDHFKSVNDRHGHARGDAVLRQVGEILRCQTRGADLVGRMGGEEFAIMLVETDLSTALDIAERIREAVEHRAEVEGSEEHRLTVSLGVAQVESDNETVASLLKRADDALYAAKRRGRNRVEVVSNA